MFSLSLAINNSAVETMQLLLICCINLGSWWDFFFPSFPSCVDSTTSQPTVKRPLRQHGEGLPVKF